MSIPPYVCGAAGLYLSALSSDRRRERGLHICGGLAVTLVGLAIVLAAPSNNVGARYAGLCVLLAGSYVAPPLTAAWLSGNTPEPGKRALVLGVNGWGNLAGVVGAQLFRPGYAEGGYTVPMAATMGFVGAALGGYAAYRFVLGRVNVRRKAVAAGKSEEEAEAERTGTERYADKKWTFIYGL